MKRILSIVAIIIIISCSYIFYQNQQPPEADDVYISTKDWAESINVLSVEKVNGEWVTFFRDN
ncbi:hypothetical protein, partial [Virgibacillus sp. DJP39]|uniref:hypothetical protein n=1 Tax=Virgibacillus sp. DJP39 TaxID=3409790 RepID=UPI003BB4E04F